MEQKQFYYSGRLSLLNKRREALHLSLSSPYLFPAVNCLLKPEQLHGQGASMETQGLWGMGHLLSQAVPMRT